MLTRKLAETELIMSKDPLTGVKKWRVYAVAAHAVEFWQGEASRLHKRLQYVHDDKEGKWEKQFPLALKKVALFNQPVVSVHATDETNC
ncbi:pyridoxamine 5'-phosphate oxidase [Penicillium maclennaniae]|uniref:pyridoxamine 5'-phosphate oxidase n=1 Tax=Penicillium maclennaniae TaxID=1343394 RepID=UPI00254060FC|nr:pyridoxamine 5'-phosphate oxidase [Penicillium maclennaniae]KAJ5669967.1 pyridoxamine 5'-phosphate oxidase [Penicillium maclennaniae]